MQLESMMLYFLVASHNVMTNWVVCTPTKSRCQCQVLMLFLSCKLATATIWGPCLVILIEWQPFESCVYLRKYSSSFTLTTTTVYVIVIMLTMSTTVYVTLINVRRWCWWGRNQHCLQQSVSSSQWHSQLHFHLQRGQLRRGWGQRADLVEEKVSNMRQSQIEIE